MHFAAISRLRYLQPGLPIPKRAIIMEIPALLGSSSSPNAIFLNQPWNRGFTCPAKLLDQERSPGRDRGERREDGAAIEPALQVHLPYQAGAGVWIIR